jgi:serine phosphatase RsbU (regulator of sigma subunit)
MWKPRDVVSGDFYWFWHEGQHTIIAAVDCTGHGIPGAFMAMRGDALLHEAVRTKGLRQPDDILHELHTGIVHGLQQEKTGNRDDMDAAICLIDHDQKQLTFSGAGNPLVYIQDGELHKIKGSIRSIGGFYNKAHRFQKHTIDISVTTHIYLFSDGYQDQFGGQKNKKFYFKRMGLLLVKHHLKPMETQQNELTHTMEQWMRDGNESQVDDIMVLGFKIG